VQYSLRCYPDRGPLRDLPAVSNDGRLCVLPGLTLCALISREPRSRFAQGACTLLAGMCRFSGSTLSQPWKMRPWQPHIPWLDDFSRRSTLFPPSACLPLLSIIAHFIRLLPLGHQWQPWAFLSYGTGNTSGIRGPSRWVSFGCNVFLGTITRRPGT
jgi:hypothetical protein